MPNSVLRTFLEERGKLEEGEARGRAKERIELTREIARKMLKKGMSVDIIKQITDLSDAEIAAL